MRPAADAGYLLITVAVMLSVLAALALLLSSTSARDGARLGSQIADRQLDYAIESAMNHANWQLRSAGTCENYADVATTPFAGGNYSATIAPSDGSPVSINAVATLGDGTARYGSAETVRVYDYAAPATLVITTDADDIDTFIEGESGHLLHNKANDSTLKISAQPGKEYRTLIEFDVSGVPSSALVQSAALDLMVTRQEVTANVEAHRLLADWSESGANWLYYRLFRSWTTPGGDYEATSAGSVTIDGTGTRTLDIESVVRSWVDGSAPNYGIVLLAASQSGNGTIEIAGSDASANRPRLTVTFVCECGTTCSGITVGHTVILSTDSDATLGGLTFTDRDLANYDPATATATMLVDGSAISLSRTVDAVHRYDDGTLLLSFDNDVSLGGISVEAGDLVRYDPASDTATLYLDAGSHFADGAADIVAVHALNNGNVVLATRDSETLGGLTFSDRDLVEYNTGTRAASLYLDGDLTTFAADFAGLHVLEDGHLVIAAASDTTIGGQALTRADLVRYEPATDTATLYFAGAAHFDDPDERFESVHIAGDSGPPAPVQQTILFVVADPATLSANDAIRRQLMESWGYLVTPIDDDTSEADLAAAASAADLFYVSEEVDHNALVDKLRLTTIGVVNEEQYQFDQLGFSDSRTYKFSADIDIVDNAHYITSVFPLGFVTIYSSSQPNGFVVNPGADTRVLGQTLETGSRYKPTLATIEAGELLHGGGIAPARRVKVPWADVDMTTLTDDGKTIMRRAIEWALGAGPAAMLPMAHWKLDETAGTAASDAAGGHTGTLENGPVWEAGGKIDGALRFDGGNDQVLVPHANTLNAFSALTMSAWVYYDGSSGGNYRVISKEPSGNNDNYWLSVAGGYLWMGIGGAFFSPNATVSPNRWYHVAGTFNANTGEIRMYLDGIEELRTTTSTPLLPSTDPLLIGASWQGKHFAGLLDDVRLYPRTLDGTEIAALASVGVSGSGGTSCNGNFLDRFDAVSFSGNDGSLSWSGDWQEIGENDGASAGDVQVANRVSAYQLRIRDNDNGGEGVLRQANLSGAASATLNLSVFRSGLDDASDYVTVDVSGSGANGPWTELGRIDTPGTSSGLESASYDLTGHISASTAIRFLGSPTLGGRDEVWFDDVDIACNP